MSYITDIYDRNEDDLIRYCQDWELDPKPLQEARASGSDRDLAFAAHHIWSDLPDKPTIRYGGFFPLCDLAEHIFDA